MDVLYGGLTSQGRAALSEEAALNEAASGLMCANCSFQTGAEANVEERPNQSCS